MIAIADRKASFSKTWINYCEEHKFPYKLVNVYSSEIIQELRGCNILLWHHSHTNYKDLLFAKQLLFSLEQTGLKVFPDFRTGWHFDDKIGQKYLLESINAPIIPSYVFYSKEEALVWARKTSYPKVFKLRAGAGAQGVKLVKDYSSATSLIKKAFSKGYSHYNAMTNFKERLNNYKTGKETFLRVLKATGRLIYRTPDEKQISREKGYVYFQDFMPNNTFDYRVIVIGDKVYGMKRLNRKGDFRASGSQNFVYDPIDEKILRIAFETSAKLGLQAVAYDFIRNERKEPVIVEMSCFFGTKGSGKCTGYYTRDYKWVSDSFNPISWILENLMNQPRSINV